MARKKRIWYPGAIYHVMSRGNRRTEIFKDHSDHVSFLNIMKMISEKHPFKIHSICLMTNHFHLLMETADTELWRIMQKILSIHAEEFNYRHGYNGHVFEGRYTSSIIEDDRYFLEVSRYIHLNPVKALMVSEPIAYEYSSYGLFMTEKQDREDRGKIEDLEGFEDRRDHEKKEVEKLLSEMVDTSRILSYFSMSPREQYRMFVEGQGSHAEQELLIRKDMKEDEMWLPQ